MQLIEPKVEIIKQGVGLDGMYKHIELCGRTCYKSTYNITDNSAKPFADRMIKSQHYAMCEFGTVYLDINADAVCNYGVEEFYMENPYSKMSIKYDDDDVKHLYVTTNLRVLAENDRMSDLKFICSPNQYHEQRITMKIICSRYVANEIVRHRVNSYAQESQRFCNYFKDKFGNVIVYIMPEGLSCENAKLVADAYEYCEKVYMQLIQNGVKQQTARTVLPGGNKTEIMVCGFASDLKHFFDLRYYGTTGDPDPEMLRITKLAKVLLEREALWSLIYNQ